MENNLQEKRKQVEELVNYAIELTESDMRELLGTAKGMYTSNKFQGYQRKESEAS